MSRSEGATERWKEGSPLPEDETLTVAYVLATLRGGRRTILFSAVGCVLAALLIGFLQHNVYTAKASFVPPGAGSQSSTAAMMGQLASLSSGGLGGMLQSKSQGDLYVGLLKSDTIARDLVRRFDLVHVYKVKKQSEAEKKLAANSLFELGSKDPIVRISVTDHSPERARDMAAAYLQALQATSAELALTESSQRRQFYEGRLASEKNQLADAEVALKQIQEKTGLVAPAGQTAANIQALAQIQAQITQRQAELAALRQNEADENPDVLQLRDQIGSLQRQADQAASGQSKTGYGRFSTAQVPELQLDYIRRARDVKYHETLFEIISKQYEAARMDEAKDAPLQVLDQPEIPDMKSGPHRSLIVALGLIVGLLGGSAWVLFRSDSRTLPGR